MQVLITQQNELKNSWQAEVIRWQTILDLTPANEVKLKKIYQQQLDHATKQLKEIQKHHE